MDFTNGKAQNESSLHAAIVEIPNESVEDGYHKIYLFLAEAKEHAKMCVDPACTYGQIGRFVSNKLPQIWPQIPTDDVRVQRWIGGRFTLEVIATADTARRLSDAQMLLDALRRDYQRLQSTSDGHARAETSLNRKLDEAKKRVWDLEEDLKKRDRMIADLRSGIPSEDVRLQLADAQRELGEARSAIEEGLIEIALRDEEIARLKGDVSSAEALISEVPTTSAEVEALKEALAKATADFKEVEGEAEELRRSLHTVSEQRDRLQSADELKSSDVTREFEAFRSESLAEKDGMQGRIRDLEASERALRDALATARAESEELTQKLDASQAQLVSTQNIEATIAAQRGALEKARAEVSQSSADLHALRDRVSVLEQIERTLTGQIDAQRAETAEAIDQAIAFEAEAKSSREACAGLERQIASKDECIQELQRALEARPVPPPSPEGEMLQILRSHTVLLERLVEAQEKPHPIMAPSVVQEECVTLPPMEIGDIDALQSAFDRRAAFLVEVEAAVVSTDEEMSVLTDAMRRSALELQFNADVDAKTIQAQQKEADRRVKCLQQYMQQLSEVAERVRQENDLIDRRLSAVRLLTEQQDSEQMVLAEIPPMPMLPDDVDEVDPPVATEGVARVEESGEPANIRMFAQSCGVSLIGALIMTLLEIVPTNKAGSRMAGTARMIDCATRVGVISHLGLTTNDLALIRAGVWRGSPSEVDILSRYAQYRGRPAGTRSGIYSRTTTTLPWSVDQLIPLSLQERFVEEFQKGSQKK